MRDGELSRRSHQNNPSRMPLAEIYCWSFPYLAGLFQPAIAQSQTLPGTLLLVALVRYIRRESCDPGPCAFSLSLAVSVHPNPSATLILVGKCHEAVTKLSQLCCNPS